MFIIIYLIVLKIVKDPKKQLKQFVLYDQHYFVFKMCKK